jgi:hypothetical protein
MFRFIRRAFPRVWVIFTIIIAFIFFAFLAFAALLLLASDDCGGESYKNEYGKCDYD